MRKTMWLIIDETEQTVTKLTYYHFGKDPKFPSWYMESNHEYKIETLSSFELIKTIELFFKCLTHFYIIE